METFYGSPVGTKTYRLALILWILQMAGGIYLFIYAAISHETSLYGFLPIWLSLIMIIMLGVKQATVTYIGEYYSYDFVDTFLKKYCDPQNAPYRIANFISRSTELIVLVTALFSFINMDFGIFSMVTYIGIYLSLVMLSSRTGKDLAKKKRQRFKNKLQ